jgi:peroxiredoxin family protein
MGEKTVIVLHSGDMDKVYSALIIGNGALAMGMETPYISPSGDKCG